MEDAPANAPTEGPGAEAESETQFAWHQEIERRIEQIDSGAVDLIPWSEASGALRSRIARQRRGVE